MTQHCHVVLPAAGSGERFMSDTPKQFCHVNGHPVIFHTVEKFVRDGSVKSIVVVAPDCEEYLGMMKTILSPYMNTSGKVIVIPGKSTRHRSIFQGLVHLKGLLTSMCGTEWENEIVIIHDGVRPFVSSGDIDKVLSAALQHKAAGLIKPLVSTVISVDADDMLEQSLDRSKYWSSEMPQAFHFGTILNAYEKCSGYDLDHGTECLQLAMTYGGVRPKLIRGDPKNLWKITHQQDLLAASAMLA